VPWRRGRKRRPEKPMTAENRERGRRAGGAGGVREGRALRFIFEVAELKRGSLMRRLAKAVLVTDTSGGVGLRTVT
jgi:hypothetical protein